MKDKRETDHEGKTLFAVGLGPGDPGLVTIKALDALRSSDTIFLPHTGKASPGRARRILSSLDATLPAKARALEIPMDPRNAQKWDRAAREILDHMETLTKAAYASLGDPFLYGSFIHIAEALRRVGGNLKMVSIGGVNSFSAAASQTLFPLASHSEEVAILSGVPAKERLELLWRQFDTLILMKVSGSLGMVADFTNLHEGELDWVCVENCGTDKEFVSHDPEDLRRRKWDYFSVILIRKRHGRGGK